MGNAQTTTVANREYSSRNKQIHEQLGIDKNKARQPWKLVLQNVRGLVTKNSNKTLSMLKDYAMSD